KRSSTVVTKSPVIRDYKHAVGILKFWLKNLVEPIIPYHLYSKCLLFEKEIVGYVRRRAQRKSLKLYSHQMRNGVHHFPLHNELDSEEDNDNDHDHDHDNDNDNDRGNNNNNNSNKNRSSIISPSSNNVGVVNSTNSDEPEHGPYNKNYVQHQFSSQRREGAGREEWKKLQIVSFWLFFFFSSLLLGCARIYFFLHISWSVCQRILHYYFLKNDNDFIHKIYFIVIKSQLIFFIKRVAFSKVLHFKVKIDLNNQKCSISEFFCEKSKEMRRYQVSGNWTLNYLCEKNITKKQRFTQKDKFLKQKFEQLLNMKPYDRIMPPTLEKYYNLEYGLNIISSPPFQIVNFLSINHAHVTFDMDLFFNKKKLYVIQSAIS
ncbi:hypothetical protein RFI_37260, partial [Reticulomyxa filosa]